MLPSLEEWNKRRSHRPDFKAKFLMVAISWNKTIQEIAANHPIGLRNPAHLSVRRDPGEPAKEAAARRRQETIQQWERKYAKG
jgi:hypothetical protein